MIDKILNFINKTNNTLMTSSSSLKCRAVDRSKNDWNLSLNWNRPWIMNALIMRALKGRRAWRKSRLRWQYYCCFYEFLVHMPVRSSTSFVSAGSNRSRTREGFERCQWPKRGIRLWSWPCGRCRFCGASTWRRRQPDAHRWTQQLSKLQYSSFN